MTSRSCGSEGRSFGHTIPFATFLRPHVAQGNETLARAFAYSNNQERGSDLSKARFMRLNFPRDHSSCTLVVSSELRWLK